MSAEACRQFLQYSDLNKHRIASGRDSVVYKTPDGQFAIKIYRQEPGLCPGGVLPPEKAVLYQDVTNKAARLTGLTCSVFGTQVDIWVNPIIDMVFDEKTGCCINISRFIAGPRVSDLYQAYTYGANVLEEVPDIVRFRWINREHLAREITFDSKGQFGLDSVEKRLGRRLGVSGIDLLDINVKMTEEGLVITDLCSCIENLRVSDPEEFSGPEAGSDQQRSIPRILKKIFVPKVFRTWVAGNR